MKLHRNAALSWNGRRRLVWRVIEQGWTITAAAGSRRQHALCAEVDRAVPQRRRGGFARPLVGASPGREPNRSRARAGDPGAPSAAVYCRRDRRDAQYGALDRLRNPDAGGNGTTRPTRARAGDPLRALTPGRARAHRHQEARPDPGRRRLACPRRCAALQPHLHRQEWKVRNTVGYEYVHIAVDDYSRLAYAEVLTDEKAVTAARFLVRALRFFRRYGIQVERVITDNGSAYRGVVHAIACRRLGLKHLRTRPYRPQTNGKAERFIRTMLGGWAYGAIYRSSHERTAALDGWLDHYNHHRRHSALGHQPPVTRTNVLGTYI